MQRIAVTGLALVAVTAILAMGCGGAPALDEPAAATTVTTEADRLWFFALGDGSVIMRDATGLETTVLRPWSEQPSDDELAQRRRPGAREIAYERATNTLWFADTHEAIHSINVETGERGPDIGGFSDAALPGCSVADLSREFALLPEGRLIVPTLLGTTLIYRTADGTMVDALDPSAFGAPLLGQFRPFTAAEGDPTGWYVDAVGQLHAFDTGSWVVSTSQAGPLPGAPASAFVEVALDPVDGLLYYLTVEHEMRGWDLATGRPVPPTFEAPTDTRAIAVG
jgi:hypothetical protein